MPARDLLAPAVAFVVLVAVIVGGAAAVPFVSGGESTDVTNLADRQTDIDAVTVAEADSEGTITMDSDAESKTVLIDRAHANQISDEKLSTLVNALVPIAAPPPAASVPSPRMTVRRSISYPPPLRSRRS